MRKELAAETNSRKVCSRYRVVIFYFDLKQILRSEYNFLYCFRFGAVGSVARGVRERETHGRDIAERANVYTRQSDKTSHENRGIGSRCNNK